MCNGGPSYGVGEASRAHLKGSLASPPSITRKRTSYPEGTTASMVLLCGRFPGHCNPTEEILSRILDPVHHSSRYSPEHLNRIEPNQISKRRLELASFTFYRWENRRLDFVDFKRQSSGSMSPIISVVLHREAEFRWRIDHKRVIGLCSIEDSMSKTLMPIYS